MIRHGTFEVRAPKFKKTRVFYLLEKVLLVLKEKPVFVRGHLEPSRDARKGVGYIVENVITLNHETVRAVVTWNIHNGMEDMTCKCFIRNR